MCGVLIVMRVYYGGPGLVTSDGGMAKPVRLSDRDRGCG